MSDEQKQGQAAPGVENEPAAPGNNDNVTNTPPEQPDPIVDPSAYWKSQAEKYERLFKRTDSEMGAIKAQMDTLQTETAKSIEAKVDALTSELEAQKAEAEKARLDAIKVKALIEKGLTPDMVEFVTANEPETIIQQVDKLAGFASQPAKGSRIGNAAADKTHVDLSWLHGHSTYKASDNIFGEGE